MRRIIYRIGIVFVVVMGSLSGYGQITIDWNLDDVASFNCDATMTVAPNGTGNSRIDVLDLEGVAPCIPCEISLTPGLCDGTATGMCGSGLATITGLLDIDEVQRFSSFSGTVSISPTGDIDCTGSGACNADEFAQLNLRAVDILTGDDRDLGITIGGCGDAAVSNMSISNISLSCNETILVVLATRSNGNSSNDGYVFEAAISGSGPSLASGIPALGTEIFDFDPEIVCAGDNITISLTNCPSCTFLNATDQFGSSFTGAANSVTVTVPSSLTTEADFTIELGNTSCSREIPLILPLFPSEAPDINLFADPICLDQEIDLGAAITTLSAGLGINLIGNWTGSHIVSSIFNEMSDRVAAEGTFPIEFTSTSCPGLVIDETILVDEAAAGNCTSVVAMPRDPVANPMLQFYCPGEGNVFLDAELDGTCADCTFFWVRQAGEPDEAIFQVPTVGDALFEITISDTDVDDIYTLEFSEPGDATPTPVPGQVILPKFKLLSTREIICEGEVYDLTQLQEPGVTGIWRDSRGFPINNNMFNEFMTIGAGISVVDFTPTECSNSLTASIEIRLFEDVRLPATDTRCMGEDLNLATESPFSIVPPGGEWQLNGTVLTNDLITLTSLDPNISTHVLEYVPTAGGCFNNSVYEFVVAMGLGAVQIFGDTMNVNADLYCPDQAVTLSVPVLDPCGSCTYFWEELSNGVWNTIANNSNTVTVIDDTNINLNTYRFTYTDECLGTPSGDTLEWILRPVTGVVGDVVMTPTTYCGFYADITTSVLVFEVPGEIGGVVGSFSADPAGSSTINASTGEVDLTTLEVGANDFIFTPSLPGCSEQIPFQIEILPDVPQNDLVVPLDFCQDIDVQDLTACIPQFNSVGDNVGELCFNGFVVDVTYSGDNINEADQTLDLNQNPGTYTATVRQLEVKNTEFRDGCLVGMASYEILAPINPFNDETVCELGEPIDLRSSSTSLPAGGEFLNVDDPTNADGIINGNEFIPQNATPQNYNIAYVAPADYRDCGIDTLFFNVDVTDAVEEALIVSTNTYCEIIDIASRFDQEFAALINNRTGRFVLEDMAGTVISDGDDFFNPFDIGAGDYIVTFFPADLNIDCNVVPIQFTVDDPSMNAVAFRDTTICQLASVDLDTLLDSGPTTGVFTSVDGTIGIMDGNVIELNGAIGTFTFEYSVAGDGCQMAGSTQFFVESVRAVVETIPGGLVCADSQPGDLNVIFFDDNNLTQVAGTYFLNDGIISPLELTDQMIDYSTLAPGTYSIDFDPDEVDSGDACIDLNYAFDVEEKTASAGTAINGGTCPTAGVDLTTFITPDATTGIGTFEQVMGAPIALDPAAPEMADFTDAMPGDYIFEHIVAGTTTCPGLRDTTVFTVTIEAGISLDDVTISVCDDATTADFSTIFPDPSIIITTEDLTAFPLGAVVPGTSVTIPVDYVSNTINGVQCLDVVSVTVDVMAAGGTISDIVDAEYCPGDTGFDLNTLSSVAGLVWYTSFDPASPNDNQITTPEAADLTGLTTVTAVIPDPDCPVMATVNVTELTCTTLMIEPIEECRGEVIDLTDLAGAAGADWFVDFTDETTNVPIDDPTMYTVESDAIIIAAIGTGMTLDTQQVTVTSLIVPIIQYAFEGEPVCAIPLDDTYFFVVDVGDPNATPVDPANIPGNFSQTGAGSTWNFEDLDPTAGAFSIIFESADGCPSEPFLIDPNDFPLDCAAMCNLPTELTFDVTDDFVCSATEFPLDITITDADPTNFIYNWLDRDGTVVAMGETTFSQLDTGLLQIQVVDRFDGTCMGIVDSTGILSIGGFIFPIGDFGASCVQDSFVQPLIVPDYIGTMIRPTVSIGSGNIELINTTTGEFSLTFATSDNLSVEVTFPALNATCDPIVTTYTAPTDCMANPGCMIIEPTFTVPDVCMAADFPVDITIDNPDPLFDYVWIDAAGNEVQTTTTFTQMILGEYTVRAELMMDPANCSDVFGPVGVSQLGQIELPVVFDEGCDPVVQDTFRASFIVPEFAGTTEAPIVTFGNGQIGNIEIVDASTGEFRVSFATDVQDFVDVSLVSAIACPNTDFTIIGTACVANPTCMITPPMFTVPDVCLLSEFPVVLEITNPDANFTYTWTEQNGNTDSGSTFSQTEVGPVTLVMTQNTDATCTQDFETGVLTVGSPQEPMVTLNGCDQDTFSASFIVPEFIGTGQEPDVTFAAGQEGRVELIDDTTGEIQVFFTTDVQDFVDISLDGANGCPATTFVITADDNCMVNPSCMITDPVFMVPDVCVASEFPVNLEITNPDSDFSYTWTEQNGNTDSGTTFSQTEVGTVTVVVTQLADATCTEEFDTGVLQVGTPAIPTIFDEGCDLIEQDRYTASFIIPEYAGTGQLPSVSVTGNQDTNVEVLDMMTGEFRVLFVAEDPELEIMVELPGLSGCPAASFSITAPAACTMTMMGNCDLPSGSPSVSDIGIKPYCDIATAGPVFNVTNGDFDPAIHGVRWFNDFSGINQVAEVEGRQFTPTVVGFYTARFYNLADPTCGQSGASTAVPFMIDGDPFFTAQDFCFNAPMPAVPSNAGGSFALNPIPTDGATIVPETGEILGAIPNTTYTIQYIDPSCGNTMEVPVTAIDVPELERINFVCRSASTEWEVEFTTTGTDITWDAGGFGVLCPASSPATCTGDIFIIGEIPLGQDITIFSRFDAGDMCAADLFVTAPENRVECQCSNVASDVRPIDGQFIYNYGTCEEIPRIETDSMARDIGNADIIFIAESLGEDTDTIKVLWYDVPTGGMPIDTGNTFLPIAPGSYYAEEQWLVMAGQDCRSIRRVEFRVVEDQDLDAGVTYPPLCELNAIEAPIPNVSGGTFSLEVNPNGADIDPGTGLLSNLVLGETYVVRYDVSGNCPSFSDSTLVYTPALAMPTVSASQCNAAGDAVSIPVNTPGRVLSANPGSVTFVSGDDYLIENVPLNTPVEIDVETPGGCGLQTFMISAGEVCAPAVDCPEPMFVTGTESPLTFCEGDMVVLAIDTTRLGPDDVIEFYTAVDNVTGEPIGAPILASSVMPTETSQYFVRIVNPVIGCQSGLVSINVIENAVLDATFDYDPTFCVGDVITPNNFNENAPTFNTNFNIERTDGIPVTTFFNSTGELVNAEPGEYVVTFSTIENANMCVDTMMQTFEVFDVPAFPDTMFVLNPATMTYTLEIMTPDLATNQTAGNLDLRPDGVYELSALVPGSAAMFTIENANGCSLVVDVIVPTLSDCDTLPLDPLVDAADQEVCFAADVSLDLSALGMIRIYNNRDRTGLVDLPDPMDFDPTMPDTFYIEAVDMDGCVSAGIDSIIVLPLPMITDTSRVIDMVTDLTTFNFTAEGTPMFDPATVNLVDDGTGVFGLTDIAPGTTVTLSVVSDDGCESEEIIFTTTGQMMNTCPNPVVPAALQNLCANDGPFDISSLGMVTLFDERSAILARVGDDLQNFSVNGADTIYIRNLCASLESTGIDSIIFFANPEITNVDSTLNMALGLYTLTFETTGTPQAIPADFMIDGPDANDLYSIEGINPGTTLTLVSETQNGCVSDDVIIQFPNANQCPAAPVIDDLVNQHLVDQNNVRQVEYCLSNVAGSLPPELEVMTDDANMVEWYEDPNGAPVDTGSTFQPMAQGIYFVRALLAADCVSDFIQIELTENEGPAILNNGFNAVCDSINGGYFFMIDAPDAVDIQPIGGLGVVSGDAVNGWMISGVPAGFAYQFLAIGANGCETTGQLVTPSESCVDCNPPPGAPVLVDPSQASIVFCTNEPFPTLLVEDPPPGFFIEWSTGNGNIVATGPAFTLPDNQASGVLNAFITDGFTCTATALLDIDITVLQAPDAFVPYSATNCLADGPIQPTGAFEPGGMFRLIDSPVGASISPTSGVINTMETGMFSIEYSITAGNCSSIDTINITVDNPDTTFYNIVDFDIDAGTFGIEFGVNTGTDVTVPMGITITDSNDTFRIMDIPVTDVFDLILQSSISGCTRMIPVSFNAVDCPPIPSPVIVSTSPFLFCENDMMSEIIANAGPNELIIWYDALTGGQELGRNLFNPQLAGITGTRTIYAEAIDMDNGCPSVMRSSIVVTSLEFLEAGADVDLGNICFRNTIDLASEINTIGNSRFELNSTIIMNGELVTDNLMPDENYIIDYIVNNATCGEDTAQVVLFLEDCRPSAEFTSVIANTLCDDSTDGEFTITITQDQFDLYDYSYVDLSIPLSRGIPIDLDANTLMGVVSGLSPGQYEIVAQDGTDIRLRDTIIIDSPAPLDLDVILVSQTTCNGDSNGSIRADISGGTTPYTIDWSTGDTDVLLSGLAAGTYTVTVTDANGCTTDPAELELEDARTITFGNQATPPMCPDQPDGQIRFTRVRGGERPLTFFLNNEPSIDDTFTGLDVGSYFPSIEDARGCRVNGDEIIISGFEGGNNISLPNEAFANPGELITVPLALNFTPLSIEWVGQGLSCTDCVNPEFTMTDGFRFFDVIVTSETGCQFRADITYFPSPEPSVYIPNAITQADNFSDRLDVNNHIFFPQVQEGVGGSMEIRIYDVWGNLVHDASGDLRDIEQLGWDGQLNGRNVESSVFSYMVRINLDNRSELVERLGTFKVFN